MSDRTELTILLFASVAELYGHDELRLPLQAGERVESLLQRIAEAIPEAASVVACSRLARNERFAETGEVIEATDTVAVIPPVAGG